MSFETSFDSKQPKLEPKLVSALSETKSLFRFYTKTESFGVSIEPKQTEDQPKQFDRGHILVFFGKFRVVSVCFETVLFVSGSKHRNKPKSSVFGFTKQTETQPKQILFWFVSVRTEIFFVFVSRTP